MNNHLDNSEYKKNVYDILENNEFNRLSNIKHHGCNRLDHSIRVSYWSYKISKFFKLDSEKVSRAALLHDFFLEDNDQLEKKDRAKTMVKHPEYALENAKKYFDLSEMEEDIILTHMFPIGKRVPKYFESWIVDIVDDVVSVYEKSYVTRKKVSATAVFLFTLLINIK